MLFDVDAWFRPWEVIWYPDNWINWGWIISIAVVGALCVLGFIWAITHLGKKRAFWLMPLCLALFIWALPAILHIIVSIIVGILTIIVVIAILALVLWAIFAAFNSEDSGDTPKYDSETGERIIKQDGRMYRKNWLGDWKADKDILGNDKVERDILGNPKIEKDWKGDQIIEKDWKDDPIVPPKKKK